MKNLRGFTLIELLITVAVAAILVSVAVPSFQNTVRENRLATQVNGFITALNLARGEAIRRGVSVTVVANGGAWDNGWAISAIDPVDASTTLLRNFPALDSNYTITALTNGDTTYTYLPTGYLAGVVNEDTYSLCNSATSGQKGRRIIVSPAGRPRVDTNTYTC